MSITPRQLAELAADHLASMEYQPATLDDGTPLPLSVAMMLVCDSQVMRLVCDANGVPLDVGRTQRVWSGEQRLAILARDMGCRYPGCDKPGRWCEIHHVITWADGGATAVANGITLCRAHHALVHAQNIVITTIVNGFRFHTAAGRLIGETYHHNSAEHTSSRAGPNAA